MRIMTGKTGTPHVTSQQFRQLVEGTVGQGSYILTSGENLEPELSSNNLLKIRSGMMSHHGNLSVVDIGTYDEVTIQNGTQGMKRIDLVVNRYTKNEETGLEDNEWVVIMGTPVATDPVAPAYTEGNLQEGDLVDDCPVYEVHLDGINVTEVVKLLTVAPNISDLEEEVTELIGNFEIIAQKKTKNNRINVSAGQKAASYIIIDAIDGYTPVLATVWSSHVTTTTSDARIVGDRVMFHFDAASNQTPETFTADILYIKDILL